MQFFYIIKNILNLLVALMLLSVFTVAQAQHPATIGVDDKLGSLVTAEWLSQHLDDPDLVVLDCNVNVEFTDDGEFRSVSGLPGYEAGHVPSAGFADLITELSDTTSPFQFTMPSAEQFVAAMGALGVGDNTRVVLYDGGRSVWAARVWWMLRWVGFDRAALLDGGLAAWTAAGHPLSTEPVNRSAQQLTLNLRPELIADRDEVYAAITDENIHIIDAMPEAHYRGEMVLYDWPGHIPSASNTPSSSLLDDSGYFRPYDELASMLDNDRKDRNITYCGGGVSASTDAFILTRLGFTDVAVYMGSLQEWTTDLNNPMEVETP
jgi:thiosulfate/3-mercaptopyruvate sulfurtransferase